MLTDITEEKEAYPSHVDAAAINSSVRALVQQQTSTGTQYGPESPAKRKGGGSGSDSKTSFELEALLSSGKKRDLKSALRDNSWPLHSQIRGQIWPKLCHQHARDKTLDESFYWDLVNQLFGNHDLPDKRILLPPFVDMEHRYTYHLTKDGIKIVDRIVCVLGFACPDITFSPMAYPIAALLLHFMTEEQCYTSLASLVTSKRTMFLPQTKLQHEVTWRTVMNISRKHVKSAAASLARQCSTSRVEKIYVDWIWWVLEGLPFTHLVRVLDCFLHEGIKVLYRVAMAILVLFQKATSGVNSVWVREIQETSIDSALNKFCKQMPVSPKKLLRLGFGIRGLSSNYINRVFIKTEMTLKSKTVLSGSRQLIRSLSNDNLPSSQSQLNVQMMSHTLTIREETERKARILHMPGTLRHMLFTLWSWLPVRITMYQPVLLYTTEEHGCSLQTFYVRVEHHEPTLLMIKTCSNEVFGAYCSSRWNERNQKDERGNRMAYFGTGETFLFSLYPERAKYPWVGMDESQVKHSAELFMAADAKMITIGGGDGQAIWMDENIRYGKTDRCLTFNNPPLCKGRDFEIKVLEVYGFGTA